ncbi:MAG: NYN domain-containing protein [Acidobacteriota bacterium]
MNPWWRRPSAESSSSASSSSSSSSNRSSERRSRGNSRRSAGSDDEERSSSRGRRRGRRGGRRSGSKPQNKAERQSSNGRQEKGNKKRKTQRIAVLLDMTRAKEGYGSCDWQPEDAAALIDRALRATVGQPDGARIYLRAYAAWDNHEDDATQLEEAGVERIEVSESATVRMVMDAVERSYGRNPCETFVLISASDDLAPVVERLRERRRKVLACAFKAHGTPALEEACDRFAFLDEEPVEAEPEVTSEAEANEAPDEEPDAPATQLEDPFLLLHQAAEAVAEDGGAVWGTLVRQTMQSMHPGFTEVDHGFENFSEMLEEAQRRGIVALERDTRSKTYYLSGLAT